MPAIFTTPFRNQIVDTLLDEIRATSPTEHYYLFLGQSESWDNENQPPTPADNYYDAFYNSWQQIASLKKISSTDVANTAPLYRWVSGTTYREYDDRDPELGEHEYYVITENNNVYIALRASGPSTNNPDSVGVRTTGVIGPLSDGYIWKYLYTVATSYTKFITTGFFPVYQLSSDPGASANLALQNQWAVQSNAVDGAVYNIKVSAGGSGYTSAPTVNVEGDGSGLTGTAVITSGAVTSITVDTAGSGYHECKITLTGGGGSGAVARAVLGPPGGFGYNPINDLRARYAIISMSLNSSEGEGDFIVGSSFRQIGILRNPFSSGTTKLTAATANALRTITCATGTDFMPGQTIEGTDSDAQGVVVHYDSGGGIIKYHQTEETGFGTFTTSDTVRVAGTAGAGRAVSAVGGREVVQYSGDIIYVENRTPVLRANDQVETIKLVMKF